MLPLRRVWVVVAAGVSIVTLWSAAAAGSRTLAAYRDGRRGLIFVLGGTDRLGAGGEDALLCCVTSRTNGWAVAWGSALGDNPRAAAVDREGHAYIAGSTPFAERGIGLASGETLFAPIYSGFLVKFNTAGDLQWAKTYSWSYHSLSFDDLVVDPGGDIIVVGSAQRSRPDDSEIEYEHAFILRCDSSGEPRWAWRLESPSRYHSLQSVDLDAAGTAHAVGRMSERQGDRHFDVWLLLGLAPDGNLTYARAFGFGLDDWARAVCVDRGNVYVGGHLTVGWNPDPRPGWVSGRQDTEAALLCMGTDAGFRWLRLVGGPEWDSFQGLGVDSEHHVYALGHYMRSVEASGDNLEGLLLKVDPAGRVLGGAVCGSGDRVTGADDLNEWLTGWVSLTKDRALVSGHGSSEALFRSEPGLVWREGPNGMYVPEGELTRAACSAFSADPATFKVTPVSLEQASAALGATNVLVGEMILESPPAPEP